MGRRRARRRAERARARRSARQPRSWRSRIMFFVGGIIMVAAGVALLLSGGSSSRLFRVAGILIVVGLVLAGIGIIGS